MTNKILLFAFSTAQILTSYFMPLSSLCSDPVNKVLNEVTKQIEIKFCLELAGIGGSLKDSKENVIYLNFNCFRSPVSIEESKKIIVEITEDLILLFNQKIKQKNLQNYLFCFPFDTKNIFTTIFIYDKSGESYVDPNIVLVKSVKNKIIIKTDDPEYLNKYKQQIEEPYIDAVIKYKGADYASTALTCQIKGSENSSDKK